MDLNTTETVASAVCAYDPINDLYEITWEAVSYTHLDVYKRQGADSGNHTNTENNANSGSTSTDNRNKTDTITLIKESLLKDNPGLPKGNAEEAENASFGTLKAMVQTSKATSNKIRWTKRCV